MRSSLLIVLGLALGLVLVGTGRGGGDLEPAELEDFQREVLERLGHIEQGLFQPDSRLVRSRDDSVEARLSRIEALASAGGGRDLGVSAANLEQQLRRLDERVQRDVSRPIEALARRADDIERTLDRLNRTPSRDLAGDIADLRRAMERIERRLDSIERKIR